MNWPSYAAVRLEWGWMRIALSYGITLVVALWLSRALGDVVQLGIAEALATFLLLQAPGVGGTAPRPRPGLTLALVAIAVMSLGVHALLEAPRASAFVHALAETTQVGVAVKLSSRLGVLPWQERSVAQLLTPLVATGVFAAPLAAMVSALAADAPVTTWTDWWLSRTAGAVIVLPLLLALRIERDAGIARPRATHATQVALAIAVLGGMWLGLRFADFPFVAVSAGLLAVAAWGTLATSAVVCTIAVVWLALLPTLEGLRPEVAIAARILQGYGLGERLLYAALSALPPLAIAAMGRDLRDARLRLMERKQKLRAIADNVPALIAHLDSELRYQFVNQRYERWWGIPPAKVLGRRPDEVLPPQLAQVAMQQLDECLAQGERRRFDVVFDDRIIDTTLVPAADVGGLNGVLILATDITERKQLQQQLEREKLLAEVTLSSIGDGVITVDRALRLTYANPAAEAMLGQSCEQMAGRPLDEVMHLRDDASGRDVVSPMHMALSANRTVSLQSGAVLVTPDAPPRAIEDSSAPIRENGAVVGGVMVFHDVSDARLHAQHMTHLAQHDPLTGLPNRVLLRDRIERAMPDSRGDGGGALMFLDLDHFKHINDSLGHPAGDSVLRTVAKRLQSAVRTVDTVSRQGGDEFVVLAPHLRHSQDAARIAEKLIRALEDPIEFDGHLLHAGVTIGIALFPSDGDNVDSVMRHADVALYQAKKAGRGRYCFYNRDMSLRAEQRLHIENELRAAVRAGQMELVFQPKFDTRDGHIAGAEALLRWRRGERLETPDAFLSIAEDAGLIPELETWVVRHACEAAARWQHDDEAALPVSVNTAYALHEPEAFVALVQRALATSGLAPHLLTLEVVERQLSFADAGRSAAMSQLVDRGVRVAVDDFGAEYSNLRYLKDFDFHELKIDREFVRGVDDEGRGQAVVAAIVGVARALHSRVVAEGVETQRQRDVLVAMGCDELQGYLLAPPLSERDFRTLLRQHSQRH